MQSILFVSNVFLAQYLQASPSAIDSTMTYEHSTFKIADMALSLGGCEIVVCVLYMQLTRAGKVAAKPSQIPVPT